MPAPYTAIAIANEFLKLGNKECKPITPMQILKLVYFADGWYSGFNDGNLISEDFQAWQYGPVVPSLYHEIKKFGTGPIDDYLTEDFENEPSFCDPDDAASHELIEAVWDIYKDKPAMELSTITHARGTPWRQIHDRFRIQGKPVPRYTTIPKEGIHTFFKALVAKNG